MTKLVLNALPIDCDPVELCEALNEVLRTADKPLCMNCGDKGCELCSDGHTPIAFDEVLGVLADVSRYAFVGLVYESVLTDSQLVKPKTNGISGRISKVAHVTLYCGKDFSYAKVVKNRQEKIAKEMGVDKPDWEAMPRQCGTRILNTPFVHHKGKLYFEGMVTKCHKSQYKLDGKFVDKSEIECYIRERSESNRQQLPEGQEVILRDFRLDNIIQINLNRRIYSVIQTKN